MTPPTLTSPTLASWFGDQRTIAGHWGHHPLVARGTATSPFGTADLDGAAEAGHLRAPYLEMTRADRQPVSVADYTHTRTVRGAPVEGIADPAGMRTCLGAGATLLLRNVDHWHPPTRALCARLAVEVGRPVEAFFFLTPPGRQGLATHRDDADVVVLQVSGTKIWHVGDGPPTPDWHSGDLDPDESPRELLRTALRPGDALYIPRGFAHHAVGANELAGHLSLTVRDTSTVALRAALDQRLAEGLRLPALPRGDDAIRDTAAALLQHYRERLATLNVADLLPDRPG